MRVIGPQWDSDIERKCRGYDAQRRRRKGPFRHRTSPSDYGPGMLKRIMLPMSRKGPYTPMNK